MLSDVLRLGDGDRGLVLTEKLVEAAMAVRKAFTITHCENEAAWLQLWIDARSNMQDLDVLRRTVGTLSDTLGMLETIMDDGWDDETTGVLLVARETVGNAVSLITKYFDDLYTPRQTEV